MKSPHVTHTPTDLVDHTIGPYHLERLLGQGGFAWVFVGRELDGTPVAVKILKPRYGGDPQFEIRFRNEAETAAKLDHPNIIRIRFVARSGDYVYFAMDLCTDSLGARLAREGPLAERDILAIAADVARGLDRSEEHTSELQSQSNLVCRLLLEKKKNLQSIAPAVIFTQDVCE